MDSNMISGTIPDMFDSTPRITDLQLQRNHLEGSIPRTLWHLSGVSTFIHSPYNNDNEYGF